LGNIGCFPTRAPTRFPTEAARLTCLSASKSLADSMRRLFEAGKIHVENYGRPSRPASRLSR